MRREPQPPQFFLDFFRWVCRPRLHRHIEGDLMELYSRRLKTMSKSQADLKFIIDVLFLLRPAIVRPFGRSTPIHTYDMYQNYLKSAWRNLAKSKVFSLINISGLALGLTCSILIALWIADEFSMDAFHKDMNRIYAVTSTEYSGSEVNGSYDTPGMLGEELKNVLPEVEYACNMGITWGRTFAVDENRLTLKGAYAGADFFRIFSYPLLLGTPGTALKGIESIAISKKMAVNLFGSVEQAMNKSVRLDDRDLHVTAVFDDLSSRVSEQFEFVINWDLFEEINPWVKDWHNSGPATYVKLQKGAAPELVKKKIRYFIKGYDKEFTALDRLELGLQPFRDKYLHGQFKNGVVSGGRIEYVQLFGAVAVFILLIASINFMNLSTARSVNRAKEIGVRKVVGALRSALIIQFISEAFLFTLVAVILSVTLVLLLLPQFNFLTAKSISFPYASNLFWLGIGLLTVVTALISGSYPAFLLSSFRPVSILKSKVHMSPASVIFRKGLVILQFALTMIFIVSLIVISRQVDFILNTDLGYKKDNLIYLPITGTIATRFKTFKNEALNQPGVLYICRMAARPIEFENSTADVGWTGKDPANKPSFTSLWVGYDFVKTMQATILYGRDFSEDFADSASYLINEEALRTIGYKDPIGMPLTFWGRQGTIVGVVKDFHFDSFHVSIQPLIIRLKNGASRNWGYAAIRTEAGKTQAVLADLEKLHQKLNPDFPFAYQFADEEYADQYQSEMIVRQLSRYFTFLAVFISCLGLLGLAMFNAKQRTKEVGIRKVLGATLPQIVTLLSRDFLTLVLFAVVIASPVGYYMMLQWLRGFEYRVPITGSEFLAAGFTAVTIAMVTVSTQAFRVARTNPVNSLKSE